MFGSQIATAFVRIRPNMTGFKSETEAGVKSGFSGLAKVAGLALGGAAAFEFGKSAVTGAAELQKQIEAINAEFGSAAKNVRDFGKSAAGSLGISADLADKTSTRFGILFGNLGIGGKQAAGMTIGLEKLAGSIAAIRGIDPATVMERLPLALAGNVRALKQLGIGIDASQIKLAAFKLGLISSTKDAVTPAVKAQAIYALATANLPKYLQLARKHSGDLANVTRRLSAEWLNAKDSLGKALLPEITKAARHFEVWLQRMQKSGKLQRDFNAVAKVTGDVVKAVVGIVKTGVGIFEKFAHAVGGTKKAAELLLAVIAVRKFVAIGNAIRIQVIQNGVQMLAREFQVAETEVVASFSGMEIAAIGFSTTLKAALISTGIGALVVGVGILVGEIIIHFSTVKRWLVEFGGWLKSHAYALLALPIIGQIAYLVMKVVENFDAIKNAARAVGTFFKTVWTHPIRAIEDLFHALKQSVGMVWRDMEKDALRAALMIVEPFSHLPGFLGGDKFRSLKDWLNGQLLNLDVKGIGKSVAEKMTSDFHHRGDAIDAVGAAGRAIGKTLSDNVVDAVKTTPKKIADVMTDAMKAAIEKMNETIANSVLSAKANLEKIGQKVADTINKILAKTNGSLGSSSSPLTLSYQKLLAVLRSGGGTVEIARAAAALQSQVDSASKTGSPQDRQQHLRDQFHKITKAFSEGKISLSTFNKDVTNLLKKDHVSYKQAGKVLGSAFTDGFRSEVAALHEQAAALNAVPARFRGRGGNADNTIKIVRPLEVIQAQQQRIATLAHRQRERQIKAAEKAARAAEKTAANTAALKGVNVGTPKNKNAKKNADAAANRHGG